MATSPRLKFGFLALLALAAAPRAVFAADGISNNFTPAEIAAEMAAARDHIAQADYWGAISALNNVVTAEPRDADAFNLLGFSYRKLRNYDVAERNYLRALRIDPGHKGALEYLGELYLETDRATKAKELLARLEQLCPAGCEELTDLREAFKGG